MPTTDKKVIFYAPPDIKQWLAEEQSRTGASISEICRRAIKLAAFGEAQTSKHRPATPVMFVQKAETR